MTDWIASDWYIFTGIAGAGIYFAFVRYVNRNPDGMAMVVSRRIRYAFTASIVVGATVGLLIMILSVFVPRVAPLVDVLFSPYFLLLVPLMWVLVPFLRQWLPLERGQSENNDFS